MAAQAKFTKRDSVYGQANGQVVMGFGICLLNVLIDLPNYCAHCGALELHIPFMSTCLDIKVSLTNDIALLEH